MGYADCVDLGVITGDCIIHILDFEHFMTTAGYAFWLHNFTLELTDDTFKILLIPHLDVICALNFYSLLIALSSAVSMVLLGSSVRLTSLELLQCHSQVLQKAKVGQAPSYHSL